MWRAVDQTREEMVAALKAVTVPRLREAGYKGSFPHFYRLRDGFIELITVQFNTSGGSFVVELSYAGPERENVYFKPETPVAKLRVSATTDRMRLGAPDGGDHWFHYGRTSYREFRGKTRPATEIAEEVATLLETEATAWWAAKAEAFS